MKNPQDFYLQPGERTKVKKGTFSSFSNDIPGIRDTIHHLLIHPEVLHLYNLNLPSDRISDRSLKTVSNIIGRIRQIKKQPLPVYRDPADRVVNICRQFAMFLCSVLREKGIPARCRCGFATYFVNGWFEDHWICEYWNKKEKRWLMVDPQLDDLQILECHIDRDNLNLTDLLPGSFFPGGAIWKMYRQGLISGQLCGFSLEKGDQGEWYIRGNMLRDYFALNKMEYTYREINNLMDRNYLPNEEELLLLDKIADLTLGINSNFNDFISFAEQGQNLLPAVRENNK
jgi:hypothetical protein